MKLLVLLLVVAFARGDDWEVMAPMPKALSDASATVIGEDTVLVVGGCDMMQLSCDFYDGCTFCPSVSTTTMEYNGEDDRWRVLAEHPRPRYRHAAAFDGVDSVYVGGGRDLDDATVNEIDVYEISSNSWRTLADMTVARSDLAAFAFESIIYFYGGYDQNYAALGSGVAVSTQGGGNAAVAVPELLERRGDFGIVMLGSVAHAVGGWSDADWCNPLATVEIADFASPSPVWSQTASLVVARGDKSLALVNGVVHVVGGEHNNGCGSASTPVDDVEALMGSGEDAYWEAFATTIPEPRFRSAAAALNSGTEFFLFGGQAPLSTNVCPQNVSFCFPITDHTWRLTFTPTSSSSSSSSKKKKSDIGRVGFFFIGALVALIIGGCAVATCFMLCGAKKDHNNFKANAIVETQSNDESKAYEMSNPTTKTTTDKTSTDAV